ncbi:response regulator [Roseateles sp. GG27B]
MAHILVIDDDEFFLEMVQQMLLLDNHRVSLLKDGEQAMAWLAQHRPDLILTDILMPNMDGVELIMQLSKLSDHTPLIAMSGGRRSITSAFNLESAKLLGVKFSLAKPFTQLELRDVLREALA